MPMRELWQVLGKLPVYNKLMVEGHRLPGLIPYLRGHQNLLDEVLTPGTPRNEGYTWWMGKLERLADELRPLSITRSGCWMSSFRSCRPEDGRIMSGPMPDTGM